MQEGRRDGDRSNTDNSDNTFAETVSNKTGSESDVAAGLAAQPHLNDEYDAVKLTQLLLGNNSKDSSYFYRGEQGQDENDPLSLLRQLQPPPLPLAATSYFQNLQKEQEDTFRSLQSAHVSNTSEAQPARFAAAAEGGSQPGQKIPRAFDSSSASYGSSFVCDGGYRTSSPNAYNCADEDEMIAAAIEASLRDASAASFFSCDTSMKVQEEHCWRDQQSVSEQAASILLEQEAILAQIKRDMNLKMPSLPLEALDYVEPVAQSGKHETQSSNQ